ncbi:unnamed protein product [Arctogadus glacialis]
MALSLERSAASRAVHWMMDVQRRHVSYTWADEALENGALVGDPGRRHGAGREAADRPQDEGDPPTAGKRYVIVNPKRKAVRERAHRPETYADATGTALSTWRCFLENPSEVHHVEVRVLTSNDTPPQFPPGRVPAGDYRIRAARFPQTRLPPADTERRGRSPERTGTATINVRVLDANDNVPVFDSSVYKVKLPRTRPKNSLVIKLNATDLDEGNEWRVYYSFSSYTPERVRQMFSHGRQHGGDPVPCGGQRGPDHWCALISVTHCDIGRQQAGGVGSVRLRAFDYETLREFTSR